MGELENNVLDAMEIIASEMVQKAGYDKTVRMQIISCQDQVLGIYKCRYQGQTFKVYSDNPQIIYSQKSLVYVLIPNNDWKKNKIITGTVKKSGIDYLSTATGDELYNLTGTNCISSSNNNNIYYLDTNNKDYKYTIYQYKENKQNTLINEKSLNEYIKKSSALLVGAVFKTNISPEKQYRGHYGIAFNLKFIGNNASEVIRTYVIDEDNMIGNPYRQKNGIRQYEIYDIDVDNFIRLESIEIFNKDFPNATGTTTTGQILAKDADIQISNLEISGMTKMLESEINGVAISFLTPQGTFFTDSSEDTSYKTITAQIKVKGKVLSSLENIPFYWGIQNVMITPGNVNYNKFLGRGWKCLNASNVIQEDSTVEWVPASSTYIFKHIDASAKDNRLKVAAVYDGNVVTKEINIKNLANQTQITIESDQGTEFYYDNGCPNLVCKINGEERLDIDKDTQEDIYLYYWAYQSNTGVLEDLPETTKINQDYVTAQSALFSLQTAIANGTRFANEAKNDLQTAKNNLSIFDGVQRVEKNKIYNVQINKITSFGTFKCSVYNRNGQYLGTAALTLTNTLENQGVYSLVINNGDVVYQYNEDGKSPTIVEGSLVPQTINSLTFTLYNNLGQAINTESILKDIECSVRWKVPLKNTLIVNNKSKNESENAFTDLNYYYYDNLQNLYYEISKNYNINNKNNQIELEVNYKGMLLTAQTNFTFVKQGDPGTNGTNYTVRIIPNTKMDTPPDYPMITAIETNNSIIYQLNYGINTKNTFQRISANTNLLLFNAELWQGGECIWSGRETDSKNNITVTWENLIDPTNSTSSFTVNNKGQFKFLSESISKFPKSNIIKCTINYQNKFYFGTIAIATAWVSDNKYRIKLKDGTGFKYVVYTTDGVNPQYDKSLPFEFQCFEVIDEIQEDVSMVAGSHKITYNITTSQSSKKGELPLLTLKQVEEYFPLLDEEGKQIPETDKQGNIVKLGNEIVYKRKKINYLNKRQGLPAMRYNGECTNIGIICKYIQNGRLIGWLHIPIHYLLNKYGLANLNDWDGNSIKIDKDGGYILSPQMGAGSKDKNNTFTGVLMGEVKEAGKKNFQTGLFGYAHGARTFFLDSQSGGALFGKNDNGRIIINPVSDRAIIVSNNYWNKDNYDEKGFPIKLDKASDGGINRKGAGMLIDLSTPQIKFGNGHFSVDNTKGIIAGWEMNKDELIGGQVHLNKQGHIFSNNHSVLNNTSNGFYLAADGLSIGSKVKITNDGTAYFGQGAVDGKSSNHWTIGVKNNNSYIAFGGTDFISANNDSNTTRIYLGTNGISLGKRFSVTPQGVLTAKSGNIGGWTINSGNLSSTSGNYKIELSGGTLQGGEYKNNKFTNNSWKISRDGSVTFTSGNIGGWKINSNSLTGGNMTINSNGSLSGSNWSISTDGIANFSNLRGHIAPGYALTGAGFSLGGGSGGGSTIGGGSGIGGMSFNPSGISVPGYGNLRDFTADIAVHQIEAKVAKIDEAYIRGALNSRGTDAYWGSVVKSVGITVTRTSDGKIKDISQNTKYIMALVGGYEW